MICEEQLNGLAKVIGNKIVLSYINEFERESLAAIDNNINLKCTKGSEEIWQLLHKLSGTAKTFGFIDFCELAEDIQRNTEIYHDKLEELKSILKKNTNEATFLLQDD